MRHPAFLSTLAALALVAACGGSKPAETPSPKESKDEAAITRAQDSINAARQFTADSLERVRLALAAERARADSIEKVRLAAEDAARLAREEAARQSAALRDELAMMVHFDVARAEIGSEEAGVLDRKAAILIANPAVRLQITGAADERGSAAYNQNLGKRRAAAVRAYLVGKGIDVSRLDELSTGETAPIADGHDETAWAENRRAEFVIVSGDLPLTMK